MRAIFPCRDRASRHGLASSSMKLIYKLTVLVAIGAFVLSGTAASAASPRPHRDAVVVEDVQIGSTVAYVVRPAHPGHHLAGVLYLHWFEPPASTQNRTEFLAEAVEIASVARLPGLPTPHSPGLATRSGPRRTRPTWGPRRR